MSLTYIPTPAITLEQVRGTPGIQVVDVAPIYLVPCLCLFDGRNYLWAFEAGDHVEVECFGRNRAWPILSMISKHLEVTWRDQYGLLPSEDD